MPALFICNERKGGMQVQQLEDNLIALKEEEPFRNEVEEENEKTL